LGRRRATGVGGRDGRHFSMKTPIPILRIFDESRAKEFYLGFLGFDLDWEHRFGPDFPLYMQISRGECLVHLSEHSGDATPGSAIRIETPELDEFVRVLRGKNYRYARPGAPEETPWGTRELCLTDPFGNRAIFYARKE
jgi:hypothetical protein